MLHPHALRPTIPGCVVHSAILELRVVLPSGGTSTLKRDGLIVKLAFSQDHQKRLHHDFDIYLHLAQRGAKGVVVHGLFSDPDSGALALVMDDGGKSLRQREWERTGEKFPRQITTTDEERYVYWFPFFNPFLVIMHGRVF